MQIIISSLNSRFILHNDRIRYLCEYEFFLKNTIIIDIIVLLLSWQCFLINQQFKSKILYNMEKIVLWF